ncbi:endolytic transglycosylase MltG [Planomonospora corallina]|uniref:Endolytic murein transglycosylase n=1 Tax=Planomonospora corallina TaxID=1806052 RepID=A0ABV8I4I9_9ACTN
MSDLDLVLGADEDARARGRSRGRSRRRRRRRGRGRFLAPLLALVVLAGVLGGGGYYGYLWLSDVMVPDDFTGQGTGEVTVRIEEGQSATDVARVLEEQGVVASARAFTNAIDAAGKSGALQPGRYTLRERMSAQAAVALLTDPDNRHRGTVLVKEGWRLSQIIDALAEATGKPEAEFEAAARDAEALELPAAARGRLEGYAFPATYEFTPDMTAADILAAMVDRYRRAAEETSLEAEAERLGRTPHEIMTIASIVQAEAGRPQDMPKMARVIYNRLALKPPMKLQMDSTVFYGLNAYGIAATDKQTESRSKYNTYRYGGLPPGPIGNPGQAAIEAALHPAEGRWLWFVTTDPARRITEFTDKESEFWRLRTKFNKRNGG